MRFLFVMTVLLCGAFLIGRASKHDHAADYRRSESERARAVLDLKTCRTESQERLNHIREREREYVDKWNQRERQFLGVMQAMGMDSK